MSLVHEEKPFGRARLSFADESEIDEFVSTLEKYERGEITADQWRAYRLVRGTYGQRQTEDAQMLRVKVPQGVLTADQLEVLADIGERYSRGFGHITTRQNIQFHFVKLHDVEPAMRLLAASGVTTREACGNSVRNITACPYAGVAVDERFDVTPYAEALTRYLLRQPISSTLPRKFKIAFEGCPVAHAHTAINDLGPARLGDLPGRAGGAPRLSAVRRLQAQAAQPHEVHDSRARLDALARGIRARTDPVPAER
jgi:sulfite reductase (NADPH) hemoprotein beta-component